MRVNDAIDSRRSNWSITQFSEDKTGILRQVPSTLGASGAGICLYKHLRLGRRLPGTPPLRPRRPVLAAGIVAARNLPGELSSNLHAQGDGFRKPGFRMHFMGELAREVSRGYDASCQNRAAEGEAEEFRGDGGQSRKCLYRQILRARCSQR